MYYRLYNFEWETPSGHNSSHWFEIIVKRSGFTSPNSKTINCGGISTHINVYKSSDYINSPPQKISASTNSEVKHTTSSKSSISPRTTSTSSANRTTMVSYSSNTSPKDSPKSSPWIRKKHWPRSSPHSEGSGFYRIDLGLLNPSKKWSDLTNKDKLKYGIINTIKSISLKRINSNSITLSSENKSQDPEKY